MRILTHWSSKNIMMEKNRLIPIMLDLQEIMTMKMGFTTGLKISLTYNYLQYTKPMEKSQITLSSKFDVVCLSGAN